MSTLVDFIEEAFHIGETITLDVTCLNADGWPINLTGATIVFRLASKSAQLLDATIGSGISLTDGPAGKCRVTISPAMQTAANVPPGNHVYELKVTMADGGVSIQAEGAFVISESLFHKYA